MNVCVICRLRCHVIYSIVTILMRKSEYLIYIASVPYCLINQYAKHPMASAGNDMLQQFYWTVFWRVNKGQ